ncbi:MAG TPA: MlaD family protein [Thermoanaerobaculales bacterium]|nr:MlaD family protein [Thermoanaerobaculales bacterium]HQL29796.1 MlaD family protein [Thermoanaerobaculales bacterium]
MRDETKRDLRVGALTLAALALLAVAILTIGQRQQLFARHSRYRTSFANVTGLQTGAAVRLSGVDVGFVDSIELPTDPEQERIQVRFSVKADYTERIREDSEAMIKTIGLLGDKYLEVRAGSPAAARVPEGGHVRGRDPAEVAELVAGGEDLMENLVSISASLKVVLHRIEAGEGLLGELSKTPEGEEAFGDITRSNMIALRGILQKIDSGGGLLGRMISDPGLADDLVAAAHSFQESGATITGDLNRTDSAYAVLFRDPEAAARLRETIDAVREASEAMAAAFEELSTGEGTLPRLMEDKEYADNFLDDLAALTSHLRSVLQKLDEGEGAAGAFLNDPQLYQDLENVVRGVENSAVTSWFIRNRRKSGEQSQAKQEAAAASAADGSPGGSP